MQRIDCLMIGRFLSGNLMTVLCATKKTEFGRPIEEVYDGVVGGDILGNGFFGEVRKVTHRVTGVSYAAKRLDIRPLHNDDSNNEKYQSLKDEVFIMSKLDHPNIVRLEEVYEAQGYLYLIEELCTGGDVFDKLDEQPHCRFTEVQCAQLVKQMLDSVRYLHSKNIVHRDLKLENFLFSSKQAGSELKLIDFGLSKHFLHGQVLTDVKGTPYTVAPEVIRGSYDEKCDLWSVGVLTYLLLCGETPFGGEDEENKILVGQRILSGPIPFKPQEAWDHVSEAGKAFVKRLLNRDLSRRPSAKEAQDDPWINEYARRDTNEGTALSPNIVSSLLEFKVMLCVTRHSLSPDGIYRLGRLTSFLFRFSDSFPPYFYTLQGIFRHAKSAV
jgi:calcium-dependent protein kinase